MYQCWRNFLRFSVDCGVQPIQWKASTAFKGKNRISSSQNRKNRDDAQIEEACNRVKIFNFRH